MYYVYLLLDPRKNNQPFYVGKGTGDRYNDHLFETAETTINKRKYNTIQKIKNLGLSVGVRIEEYFSDEIEAYLFEEKLIAQYGRKGYDVGGILTNICDKARPPNWQAGPNANRINEKIKQTKSKKDNSHTQDTKDKISAKLKGKKKPPRSEQHRLAMSNAKKGKPLTKPCSDETKLKRSINQTGKVATEETKQAISKALTGRKLSEEHKAKIKAAMLAKKVGSQGLL